MTPVKLSAFAQELRLSALYFVEKKALEILKTAAVFKKKIGSETNKKILFFLAGLKEGWELQQAIKEERLKVDVLLLFSPWLSFYSGFLLSLSHSQAHSFLGCLAPKSSHKKEIIKELKSGLAKLRQLSFRPVEGLEKKNFDIFPYYHNPDRIKKIEIKRWARLLSRLEKIKLSEKEATLLFALDDLARFFGREKHFLLYYIRA